MTGAFLVFQYDSGSRLIVVDLKKPKENRSVDLPRMAYYLEKDVGSISRILFKKCLFICFLY